MKKYKNELLCITFLTVFSLAYVFYTFDIANLDINIPITIGGDGTLFTALAKTLKEFGWYNFNPHLGAPFGRELLDFPFYADTFHLIILKVLLIITDDLGLAINLFLFLLYPITAIISYLVMKQIKVNNLFSILGSLTFAFLPYRFLRLRAHTFLAAYYMIPILLLITIWLMTDNDFLAINKNFFKYKRNIFAIIVLVIYAICGMYYAFFGCFFIVITIVFKIINNPKSLKCFFSGAVAIGTICLSIFLSYIPTLIFLSQNGKNELAPQRSIIESEVYALRITGLLIPIPFSNTPNFFSIFKNYTPLVPSEGSEYLGLIASIGLIFLLLILFKKQQNNLGINKHCFSQLTLLSRFTVCAVLLSTVAGFGSIFSMLISANIRAYNRISVFIAYFAIVAVCMYFSNVSIKNNNIKHTITVAVVIIFLIGIYWQSGSVRAEEIGQKEYKEDLGFINQIEETLDNNAMVYQLPYQRFPEEPPIVNMGDYAQSIGYLGSKQLRWSYGAYKGRDGDAILKSISQLPVPMMLNQIKDCGYTGLMINADGYTEEALKKLTVQIEQVTHIVPILSKRGNLLFYDLRNFSKDATISNTFVFTSGTYDIEFDSDNMWIWSQQRSQINVINLSDQSIQKRVEFTVANFSSPQESNTVTVVYEGKQYKYTLSLHPTLVSMDITLQPGKNVILLETDALPILAEGDQRDLYFTITGILPVL